MEVAAHPDEVRAWRRAVTPGGRVGLVPTMGALHPGHLALLQALRPRVTHLALSIFVNPTQFGPGEDLDRYPRTLAGDLRLAAAAGADLAFTPAPAGMYPLDPPGVFVSLPALEDVLEGAARPGHLRGVATVVTKLLALFRPDMAAFGQKDGQQCVLVRRLARELLLPAEIVVVPTVREPDGLALSSRNRYLTPQERSVAPALHAALQSAATAVRGGERDASRVEAALAARVVAAAPQARLDYAAVRAADDLAALPGGRLAGRVLLLVAARFPNARLLDNLCLEVAGGAVAEVVL